MKPISTFATIFALSAILFPVNAQTPERKLKFSGFEWRVKSGEKLGPGPNVWNPDNVFVDGKGFLHLKITSKNGQWSCAEISSAKKFGFGTFQFQIVGRVDKFDPNIVLGLFTYPTPDVGGDTTNEIDIEFAHWGNAAYPIGNYTVWAPEKGVKQSSKTFEFLLEDDKTTQRFHWKSESILFQSLRGHAKSKKVKGVQEDNRENEKEYGRWLFSPADFKKGIPQKPVPVFLNLWLFGGKPPVDGKEVEIIVTKFTYTPQ